MPALQGEQLLFVAEGDLWRAPAQGGGAQRLSSHAGSETHPALSPDGRWLAFIGQYDGGAGDVYVMPAAGGVPKRLSWNQSAQQRVWGISAQGEVIFTGPNPSGQPGTRLLAADIASARLRALPVNQASDGALSADGRQLFFTRNGLRGDNARLYRGGGIARLWALDLDGQAEARALVDDGHNNLRPQPYRDAGGALRIAFLSDRDGRFNLWSVDAKGQDLRQHTRHRDWDIRQLSLAADGRALAVYSLGADLYRLDLGGGAEPQRLAIGLSGDFDQQRQRWIDKPQDFLSHLAFAPDGERVLLTSRGRLATQGAGPLRRAELPLPAGLKDGGRCREAKFSADSKQVFALCDFGGELEVWRFAADGLSPPQQLTRDAQAMRLQLQPSPDGRYLAHSDKEGRLYLTDLQAKAPAEATREIDRDRHGNDYGELRWSPDGRALAYSRNEGSGWREQLMLYTPADQRLHVLTGDRYDSASPAFSPDGRWLYFLSRRHFATSGRPNPWGDRNMGPSFERGWKVYALALQAGPQRFPFAAADELQPAKPDEKPETKPEAKSESSSKPRLPEIATAGLAQRLYELPLAPGNYSELATDGKRLWLLDEERGSRALKSLPIGPQESKTETLAEQVQAYALSRDGKKLMLRRGAEGATPEILIVESGPKLPTDLGKAQVRWSDWQIATEPRAEWRQMFHDAWRMQRDFFYDKALHGVDWNAMRDKYAPLVERVTERGELSDLLQQLVGELSLLHSQVIAPDVRKGPQEPGLAGLGAELQRVEQGWRVERLYTGDPELPAEAGPLAAPGLAIAPGALITRINGRPAAESAHPSELLRGQAGRQVLLELQDRPGAAARRVIVTPVDAMREARLRLDDWRYGRARAVAAASQGRIGYLHLRAMGRDDIADFAREFYAQVDREGLIIDVRHNGGGNIDSWILNTLLRRAWMFWQRRSPENAPPGSNMQQTFRGQVVVLANEETYSDGETFTEGFKRLGLGPVIGRTTAGAGVWLSDRNRLADNGMVRAAETGQFLLEDGRFIIEGQGVRPDIEVDNPPRASALGQDAQLDAALAWLRKAMSEKPLREPRPGPYPRPLAR
ncbi:peptidase S41 [Roseateles sp. DAIF2]|nr:peptidase S41 [Roseateles sp. DAIF2]